MDFFFVLPLCSHDVDSDSSSHFTDTVPNFHEHPDHVKLKSDAVPEPSHEKNYKTDPSIQPSEVIYMQIKER